LRKLLNVLYVTTPDAYLAKDGENVLVLVGEETKLRVPIHNLEGIVCFGHTGASPALMHLCTERNVALSFHSQSGRSCGDSSTELQMIQRKRSSMRKALFLGR